MKRITRKIFLSPLLAIVALAVTLLTPLTTDTASAATPYPISGSMCSGNLCIRIYLPSSTSNFSKIIVREWAWKYAFYGHFELLVPGVGTPYNSTETTYVAGGVGHSFTVPNNDGRFTAHAWQRSGTHSWSDIGTVGFNGSYI